MDADACVRNVNAIGASIFSMQRSSNLDEVRAEWEKVKFSYEILSDPKTRKNYDRNSSVAEVLEDPGAAVGRAVVGGAMSGIGMVLGGAWKIGEMATKAVYETAVSEPRSRQEQQPQQPMGERVVTNGNDANRSGGGGSMDGNNAGVSESPAAALDNTVKSKEIPDVLKAAIEAKVALQKEQAAAAAAAAAAAQSAAPAEPTPNGSDGGNQISINGANGEAATKMAMEKDVAMKMDAEKDVAITVLTPDTKSAKATVGAGKRKRSSQSNGAKGFAKK